MISRKKLEFYSKKMIRLMNSSDWSIEQEKKFIDQFRRSYPDLDDLVRLDECVLAHSLNDIQVGDPIKANNKIRH